MSPHLLLALPLTRTRTSCLLPRCVRQVVQGPPKQLVECVAHEVAKHILRGFPLAQGVSVRVTKPHVAVPGALESLGAWLGASVRDRVVTQAPDPLRLPSWLTGVEIHRVRGEPTLR